MRYRSAFNSGNAYRLADTAGECQQRKFPSERPLDAEAPALECQWDNLALRGPSGRVQRVRVTTRREAAGLRGHRADLDGMRPAVPRTGGIADC